MPVALPRIPRTAADVGALPTSGGTLTGALTLADGLTARGNRATLLDPRDFGATPTAGLFGTDPGSTVRDANTQAFIDAAAYGEANGGAVCLNGLQYYVSEGIVSAVPFVDFTRRAALICPDTSGTVLDLQVSDNYGVGCQGFMIFGPGQYLAGSGTTYTTKLLSVGRASGGGANHVVVERMHLLGGYTGIDALNSPWLKVLYCDVQHQRMYGLDLSMAYNSDAGDVQIIGGMWHPNYTDASEYTDAASSIHVRSCSGLTIHGAKFYQRTLQAIHLDLNDTFADSTYPQVEIEVSSCFGDSGHLVADSAFVRAAADAGTTGEKLYGLRVINNRSLDAIYGLHVTSASGAITDITYDNNSGGGGGGVYLGGSGTIDFLSVDGNRFNRNAGLGAHGPTKFITVSGPTITNAAVNTEKCVGYSAGDIADSIGTGGTADYSPAMVELVDGATVTVTVDTAKPRQKHRVVLGGSRTITWDTGIGEGTEGDLWVVQDATGSRTVTWTAPTGIEEIRWKGNSAPTLTTTAHAYDLIRWEVVATENGTYLMLEACLNFGTVTPAAVGGFTMPSISTLVTRFMVDPAVSVYDADTGCTEVTGTNDASIGRILDAVGGSLSFAQATSGSRPTLKTTAGPNSKPVARFDGGDSLTLSALGTATSRPYTMFIVAKTTDSNTTIAQRGALDIGNKAVLRQRGASDSDPAKFRWTFADNASGQTSEADRATGSWQYVMCEVTTNGGGESTLRVNGTQVAQSFVGLNNLLSGDAVTIGDTSGMSPWIGDIALVIFCSGVDATDRNAIESAIATYFGL